MFHEKKTFFRPLMLYICYHKKSFEACLLAFPEYNMHV